jgi:arylsulfatase A-like enzyme
MAHITSPDRRVSRRAAALLAAAALCAPVAIATAAAPRPNIVFILADDLGWGDVGYNGQQKIQTPNIDALAKEGMRFTQAYAGAPVCAPSRCTLLTGLHTGHALIRGNTKVSLGPKDRTIEEILKESGYDTAAFGKWGLGEPGTDGTPYKKGFNYFYGFIDQTHAHNSWPTFLYRNDDKVELRNVVPRLGPYGQGVATVKKDFGPDLCNEEALAWLSHVPADHPFFLYVPMTPPHANDESHSNEVPDLGFYADKPWTAGNKSYAALVTHLDGYVGQIMDKLRERKLLDNTLVIFTSDNGVHAEGSNDPGFFDSSGPFRGIKRDMYEGGFREPMIAVWPGHIAPGSSTDQIFAFWDFPATAAELAGVPPIAGTDGISLAPTFEGVEQKAEHPFYYWEYYERGFEQAVRIGDWKGLRHAPDKPLELYDLKSDIGEKHDVAADHADIVAKIKDVMTREHTDSPLFPVRTAN